ncbi:hypothetical protein [Nonomuraea sediminis]|uniref:hypothetical protein n=1 Tax=Nonomuraea sediminis TaxID=2835864 RepID=UPI001BDCDDBA|nr:hypothetical protein [Nonomuraea sediminis]
MKQSKKALVAGVAAAGMMAGSQPAIAAPERGSVVSAERLDVLSAGRVTATLKGDRGGAWDTSRVRYGVETYRLVYRTVDPSGRRTTASGLVALPRNAGRQLRTVSFTHGTELFRGDAPSVTKEVWGKASALTYASAGMAVVAPDYLGMGKGPGAHPWMDIPSETTATLDMLRAARVFAARKEGSSDVTCWRRVSRRAPRRRWGWPGRCKGAPITGSGWGHSRRSAAGTHSRTWNCPPCSRARRIPKPG